MNNIGEAGGASSSDKKSNLQVSSHKSAAIGEALNLGSGGSICNMDFTAVAGGNQLSSHRTENFNSPLL